uniref:Uncharacterized protein n=1 Tax=Anopheles dirus TaxID=7168 RepID=A0A182NNE3_9DIPT
MLVAVVIMFAGCYFPVHMLNVASAINPVIYNFMS